MISVKNETWNWFDGAIIKEAKSNPIIVLCEKLTKKQSLSVLIIGVIAYSAICILAEPAVTIVVTVTPVAGILMKKKKI